MKCRSCGRKNAWQSEFCSGCGKPLEAQVEPPAPTAPGTGAESWRWNIIWLLVALAVVALLCIYAFQPSGKFKGAPSPAPPVTQQP